MIYVLIMVPHSEEKCTSTAFTTLSLNFIHFQSLSKKYEDHNAWHLMKYWHMLQALLVYSLDTQ